MGKVAVSLGFVREQQEYSTMWSVGDTAAATNLVHAVASDPLRARHEIIESRRVE